MTYNEFYLRIIFRIRNKDTSHLYNGYVTNAKSA